MNARRLVWFGLFGILLLAAFLSVGCGDSRVGIPPPDVSGWEMGGTDTWISVNEKNKDAPLTSLSVSEFTGNERNGEGNFDRVFMYITVDRNIEGRVTYTRVFVDAEIFPYYRENISGSKSLYFLFYPEKFTEILRSDGSVNFDSLYSSPWVRFETAMPALQGYWRFKPTGPSPHNPLDWGGWDVE